jgi:hypothetical protein
MMFFQTGTLCKESESGIFSIFFSEMSILGSQEAGHRRNWEHRQNWAPDRAQSGLIGFGQV